MEIIIGIEVSFLLFSLKLSSITIILILTIRSNVSNILLFILILFLLLSQYAFIHLDHEDGMGLAGFLELVVCNVCILDSWIIVTMIRIACHILQDLSYYASFFLISFLLFYQLNRLNYKDKTIKYFISKKR